MNEPPQLPQGPREVFVIESEDPIPEELLKFRRTETKYEDNRGDR
jgi:hypothetical protein